MIVSVSFSFSVRPLSQDTAQSAPDVAIHGFKRFGFAVFEVFKPSSQRSIQILADPRHAASLAAPGLPSNRVFEPVHALLARPFHALLEVIAEKVKSDFQTGIHDARLCRMRGQPILLRPLAYPFQSGLSFRLAPALNDKIVRIPGHGVTFSRHQMIQWV